MTLAEAARAYRDEVVNCHDCATAERETLDEAIAADDEVVTLARQWANCEPGSLPDGIARNRMRRLFGLDES